MSATPDRRARGYPSGRVAAGPHRPVGDRRDPHPQPGRARAAGRDRQLVRAPAGQALRRRPRGLGDGLELRDPLPQREDDATSCCASTPTSARGGPVSIQLFGHDPEVMRSAAATVAERGRRPHRPQHGLPGAEGVQDRRRRRAARGPRHRRRGRARRARGQRAAGHRQAALRPARRARPTASSSRTGSSTRPASPRIAFHPRTRAGPPQGHARLRRSRRGSSRSCRVPVILSGGLRDAERGRSPPSSTPAPPPSCSRAARSATRGCSRRLLGTRDDEPTATRSSTSSTG